MMIGRSVSWCFHHQWFGSHGGEAGDMADLSCSGHHGLVVRSSKEFYVGIHRLEYCWLGKFSSGY